VPRRFVRNFLFLSCAGGVLLLVSALSDRGLPVLPADASPEGILVGGGLIAVALTAVSAVRARQH
jgi:hypothetical protein